MSTATDDPRIGRGMAAQLAARGERIAAGETPIGWKVGFGTQAAMQRFGLAAPLVGFLTDRGLVPSGGTVSLEGWDRPAAEPEIAGKMGRDLAAGADEAAARAAISALAPA